MITLIVVKLQIEGLHHWPNCDIEEVSFLKNPHRHIFHITCKKEVTHDDRDIEIIMFKRKIHNYIVDKWKGDFGSMSCEMIASDLLKEFGLFYCKVLEDNENGAEVTL
jgi:hypothetical protein